MEKRIVTASERAFRMMVNDIEHIESQSMPGIAVIKVFFQPGAKVEAVVVQLRSVRMEEGRTHVYHRAATSSNVPVLQSVVLQHLLDVLTSRKRSPHERPIA